MKDAVKNKKQVKKSEGNELDWRRKFFAKQFTKKGLGLEIGPSHSPIAAKSGGYNVKVLDHANQKDLIKKYKALDIDTSRIEKVDYVWNGKQSMSELIGKPHSFDYIIASHVIEHTTDLLTFVQDCEKLLKPTGKLCLAIPDKRYHFDYFRFPTTAGDVIDVYQNKVVRHTPGRVFDFLINAAKRDEDLAWSSQNRNQLSLAYDAQLAIDRYKEATLPGEYFDIHNWMFTPESFRLLIADLQLLGLTKLSYVDEMPTQGFEFFAILSPKAPAISTPRVELVQGMMSDMRAMLGIDLQALEQELRAMRESKRWRYASVIAKTTAFIRKRS